MCSSRRPLQWTQLVKNDALRWEEQLTVTDEQDAYISTHVPLREVIVVYSVARDARRIEQACLRRRHGNDRTSPTRDPPRLRNGDVRFLHPSRLLRVILALTITPGINIRIAVPSQIIPYDCNHHHPSDRRLGHNIRAIEHSNLGRPLSNM